MIEIVKAHVAATGGDVNGTTFQFHCNSSHGISSEMNENPYRLTVIKGKFPSPEPYWP